MSGNSLRAMTRRFAQPGRLESIWLRERRDASPRGVAAVQALAGRGL